MSVNVSKPAHGVAAAWELELGMKLIMKIITMEHTSMALTTMIPCSTERITMELCTKLGTER
jgi:hypothetical protein